MLGMLTIKSWSKTCESEIALKWPGQGYESVSFSLELSLLDVLYTITVPITCCDSLLFTENYFHRNFWICSTSFSQILFFSRKPSAIQTFSGFSSKLSWKARRCFLEELLKIPACVGLSGSWSSVCPELCLCWMLLVLQKAVLNRTCHTAGHCASCEQLHLWGLNGPNMLHYVLFGWEEQLLLPLSKICWKALNEVSVLPGSSIFHCPASRQPKILQDFL